MCAERHKGKIHRGKVLDVPRSGDKSNLVCKTAHKSAV